MKKIILIFIALGLTIFSFTQPNKIDSTFGSNGIRTTFFGTKKSIINDIALQTDGKIVAVGKTDNGEFDKIALARYNIDGSLDSNFGEFGLVITSIGKKADMAKSVAIQTDGRIVVAGYTYNGNDNDFALLRYNRDGTLDKSFGKGGIVTTAIGVFIDLNDRANSVALQPDGKIVVGGTASGYFCLVRYNRDGSQDETFNYDGVVSTPVGTLDNDGRDIALQADGKIVIVGPCLIDWDWDCCVLRYTTDGLLDTTFGKGGIVVLELEISSSVNEEPFTIGLQKDGRILLAGNFEGRFLIIGLLVNGMYDKTFGINGLVYDFFGDVKSMTVQQNDKFLIAGKTYNYTSHSYAFAWIRYNANGTPDCSRYTEITAKHDEANSILIQPDGKILVAGHSDLNFTLVRYMGDITNTKVDIYNPSNSFHSYPNPVKDKFTLDYVLEKDDFVTLELSDMFGRKIITYLNNEKQYFGNYYYSFALPDNLVDGNYLINFSSQNFQKRIRIIKN